MEAFKGYEVIYVDWEDSFRRIFWATIPMLVSDTLCNGLEKFLY